MFILAKRSTIEISTLEDLTIDRPADKTYRLVNTSMKNGRGNFNGYNGHILAFSTDKAYLEKLMLKVIEHAIQDDKIVNMSDIEEEVMADVYPDE